MQRRRFIRQSSAFVSASAMVPAFLRQSLPDTKGSRAGKILVVIQLSGGNDGLNTVVPYEDDHYFKARPSLHIPKKTLIPIGADHGIHPSLTPLRDLYEEGQWSIVNGVGYPNPNRSHFRSMDIWQTGSDESKYLSSGWLGRYLDSNCKGCDVPYHAIELGDNLSLALQGVERDGFAMRDPRKLVKATENQFLRRLGQQHHPAADQNHLNYLYKTMIEVQQSAQYIADKARGSRTNGHYPQHGFGRGLRQISELILADAATQIYYISLPGFDTHVNQTSRHSRLLKMYAESMQAFASDLKANKLFEEVCVLTFSEFGRRVSQNGSGGTDHGAANCLFIMGGDLSHAGLYNPTPSLDDLDQGDLRHEIDFRHVYSNILNDWLNADATQILGVGQNEFKVV